MTRYVVLYTVAQDVEQLIAEHFPAHMERYQAFHAQGTLLGIGTFGDPLVQGSMAIFTTREAAQEFIAGDPFVLHGVVAEHEVRDWDDVLAG